MSRSVYFASPEALTGKSAVALRLLDALTREVGSVGVFRPLTTARSSSDDICLIVDLLVNQLGISQSYDEATGVTYEAARDDADEALHSIVERFGQLTDRFGVILVIGSDYTDVAAGTELSFNAKIAANLGSPVVLVVHGRQRSPEQIRAAADSAIAELRANHAHTVAVIANRVDHDAADAIRRALADLPDVVTAAITESPLLSAPAVRALLEAADAELVAERDPHLLFEGPIQYDAAIDPEVARTKLPDSPVAGRATVFIFPDLNTCNNTYKAVQRSARAIAIGPVLQGLRKPVNDLSRGALISDIVNTVAITAVQAQAIKQTQPVEATAEKTWA